MVGEKEIKGALRSIGDKLLDGLVAPLQPAFDVFNQTATGTPAPTGRNTTLVVVGFTGGGLEPPWNLLVGPYWNAVVPLAVVLLTIGAMIVGIRTGTGSVSAYEYKTTLRRIAFVYLLVLFWLPVAGVGLSLLDSIVQGIMDGYTVYGIVAGSLAPANLGLEDVNFPNIVLGGMLLGATAVNVSIGVVLTACRYAAVVHLTFLMPIYGVLWALDTWPLSSMAAVGRKAASVYGMLSVLPIPVALQFRFLGVLVANDVETTLQRILVLFGIGRTTATDVADLFPFDQAAALLIANVAIFATSVLIALLTLVAVSRLSLTSLRSTPGGRTVEAAGKSAAGGAVAGLASGGNPGAVLGGAAVTASTDNGSDAARSVAVAADRGRRHRRRSTTGERAVGGAGRDPGTADPDASVDSETTATAGLGRPATPADTGEGRPIDDCDLDYARVVAGRRVGVRSRREHR